MLLRAVHPSLRSGSVHTAVGVVTRGLPLGILLCASLAALPAERGESAANTADPTAETAEAATKVDFNREIRPILSENCFVCHGPDAGSRQAELRLDMRETATGRLATGGRAIVSGKAGRSKLIRRVSADDAEARMPPPETGKRLSAAQIELLRRWIDQGAEYQRHWAYIAPSRPAAPETENTEWPRHDIDQFILARLEREGLQPSPEADPTTLIRRLSLDLTGLPPTLDEIDAFVADRSFGAYENVVDRLLSSPRYGERMAIEWLDAARYADTNGYHIDNERFMWRWRDWVIDALNRNMPFDQFTVEQLAGDLLPEATLSQQIASGFNRNHMINFEGGAIPEEYLNEYVLDRVQTTATVWMGMTIGCARCHDHKFDPVSQTEFYQFYAFFNNVAEKGLDGNSGNAQPSITAPLPEQQEEWARLKDEIETLKQQMDGPMPEVDAEQVVWQVETAGRLGDVWTVVTPHEMKSTGGATLSAQPDMSILVGGENPDTDTYELTLRTELVGVTGIRFEVLMDESLPEKGPGRSENGNFVLTEFEVEAAPLGALDEVEEIELSAAHADHSQAKFAIAGAIDGDPKTAWAPGAHEQRDDRVAVFIPRRPIGYASGTELRIRLKHESQFTQHAIGRFRLALTTNAGVYRSMSPTRMSDWWVIGPFRADTGKEAFETAFEPEEKVDTAAAYQGGAYRWARRKEFVDGKIHLLSGENSATYLTRTMYAATPRRVTLSLGSDDAIKVWLNEKLVHDNNVARGVAADQDMLTLDLDAGENRLLMKIVNFGGGYGFYFDKRLEQSGDPPLDIVRILAVADEQRSEQQAGALRSFYRGRHSPAWNTLDKQMTGLRDDEKQFEAKLPKTMVMRALDTPRKTYFLKRGQYDQRGDEVTAAVPAFLPPLADDAPGDRLGLARWLVDERHPLTARATVNRMWQMLFGAGLVRTPGDFGLQGAWPSHPKLLDWLAREFIQSGWDVKHMLRLMVTSATYRQSSRMGPEALSRDPQNRLLARSPRLRLPAELIRDNALSISGLLIERIGGASVKPYQPPGLWRDVSYSPDSSEFSAQVFKRDDGQKLYRRGLYTFWKRSAPPPGMTTFDAPNREICTVRRPRTNTPLQALALMNDETYVEAARALGQRMMSEADGSPRVRIRYAFRLATARAPTSDETDTLNALYESQLAEFRANGENAQKLLSVGASARNAELDAHELAAWTTVASVILNLDETITRN